MRDGVAVSRVRGRRRPPSPALVNAVKSFYSAIAAARAHRVLVVSIDVTRFTERELANLRGTITAACHPRDRHYPSRSPSFSIRSVR